MTDNTAAAKSAKPIPGVSDEVSDFVTCLLLHMILPLLPLIIETWKTQGNPTDMTLAISTSMYSIAIGMSSRNKAIFAVGVFVSILFSIVFGMLNVTVNGQSTSLPYVQGASLFTMFLIFVMHGCERYNKHVVECKPFWDFGSRGAS
ncbi:hypothetical protein [Vibrio chagasii]|uniref:hypothetical protein n=1 Tax=Vibrio chagasii TaxID=170679 RepID=UPI00406882CE